MKNKANVVAALMALVALWCALARAEDAPAPAPARDARGQDASAADQWKPIFNGKDLSGWYTFLKGIGKDSDPNKIFQIDEGGVIHVYKDAPQASTQPFGYICTKQEYGDCRVRIEYKWGEKRFGTRATKRRDSGLLYFVFGEDGKQGGTWPWSVECQIQEQDVGDIYAIGTVVSTMIDPKTASDKAPKFLQGGESYTTPGKMNDRIIRSEMLEKEGWNVVEVVLEGDGATHIVNGKVNMKISGVTRADAEDAAKRVALVKGRILLQAEGAEVMFRKIEVAPLKKGSP